MSNQISWLLENRVILVRSFGEITVEELESLSPILREYVEAGQAPLVHMIFDSREVEKFPMNLASLSKVFLQERLPSNTGWVVVLTSNRALSFVSGMLAQLGRSRFRTFKTMEEATTFLNDIDSTLPALSLPQMDVHP